MSKRLKTNDKIYPPRALVFGSILILLCTLEYVYGYDNKLGVTQSYPGSSALLRELGEMTHREGIALGITVLYLLE
ncbi:MAG: hypothetical protein ACI9H6_000076 [Patiriisocius sp.]|jgi:hypothetical protein